MTFTWIEKTSRGHQPSYSQQLCSFRSEIEKDVTSSIALNSCICCQASILLRGPQRRFTDLPLCLWAENGFCWEIWGIFSGKKSNKVKSSKTLSIKLIKITQNG